MREGNRTVARVACERGEQRGHVHPREVVHDHHPTMSRQQLGVSGAAAKVLKGGGVGTRGGGGREKGGRG